MQDPDGKVDGTRTGLVLESFSLQGFNRLREIIFVDAFLKEYVLSSLGSRSIGDGYRLIYDLSVDEEQRSSGWGWTWTRRDTRRKDPGSIR